MPRCHAPDTAPQCLLPAGLSPGARCCCRHDGLSQCASEDDGYLLCFVHDEGADSSELRIYDAASMDPEPLARLATPQRVPYGFHGTFLREAQVQRMMSAAGASSAASLVAA
jgi:hypothetical protein